MASPKVSINMPSLPNIEVKLEGEWVKVNALINGMAPAVISGYEVGVAKCSKLILQIVKRAIRTGTPPPGARWPALAKTTVRTHGKHKIYNLRGFYSRNLAVTKLRGRTIIGVARNVALEGRNGRSKGITLNQLAIILEHGSRVGSDGDGNGIPKRPLWAPSFKAYGGVKKIKVEIMKQIRRSLISRFHLTANQIRQSK